MDEDKFRPSRRTAVFGRITPELKERLVGTFREQGHYVAMTGDGVNDVLSLKRSNLAIAMGSGSQATRGVADLILINDGFSALASAIGEGQRILNGMQDILRVFLARILTLGMLIVSALVIGFFPSTCATRPPSPSSRWASPRPFWPSGHARAANRARRCSRRWRASWSHRQPWPRSWACW